MASSSIRIGGGIGQIGNLQQVTDLGAVTTHVIMASGFVVETLDVHTSANFHNILLKNIQDPIFGSDAATKYYVDTLVSSVSGGGYQYLSELHDVNLNFPENGQVLVYEDNFWVNQNPTSTASVSASEDIDAFSLVTADGYMANSNDLTHFGQVIGFSITPILAGSIGRIVLSGEVMNPIWVFARGAPVFLNGLSLATSPPSMGFVQQIGSAVSNNKISVQMKQPIKI